MNIWFFSRDVNTTDALLQSGIDGLVAYSDPDQLVTAQVGVEPGLLILAPDAGLDQDLKQFFTSHFTNHWTVIALAPDLAAPDISRLYDLGCDEVLYWDSSPDALVQLIAGLALRHRHRSRTVSLSQQEVLENAKVVIWEFDVKTWRYVYVSDSVEDVLGYPPQRWYENNFTQVLLHPDDRERFMEFIRLAIKQPSSMHEYRCRMLGAGGRVIWFRLVISIKQEVSTDAPRVCGIALDITSEIDYLRQRLNVHEHKFSQLEQHLNRAPIAVLGADSEMNVTSWSPGAEAMFGIPAEAAIGHPWHKLGLIHPEDEARVVEELAPLLNGQVKYQEVRNRNIKADGSIIHVHWVNTCLRDEDGKLTSLLSMGRDLTAEINNRQQLQQIAQLDTVAKFTSGIAHDFRNLLTPILINAENILGDDSLPAPVRDAADKIARNTYRANRIIATLLNVNKPLTPEYSRISTAEFAMNLKTAFSDHEHRQFTIELDLDKAPDTFNADETLLHLALVNLIDNGCDAMQSGGVIKLAISLDPRDKTLAFRVSDSGKGMPELVSRGLFTPFFTHAKKNGTGLGLVMVKKVCEAHNGDISIESEENVGTTCTITIPCPTCTSATKKDRPAATGAATPSRALKIMVVEDDELVIDVVAGLLESLGHEAVKFPDANQALAELTGHANRYDVLITDQHMPNLTGVELISSLLRNSIMLPVLLMSGSSAEIRDILPGRGGLIEVLEKPVSKQQLQATLETLTG